MKKTILNVKYLCPGELSQERYVQITNFKGRKVIGLFQKHHMQSKSKLIVTILSEEKDKVLLEVPHGGEHGIYNEKSDVIHHITVKKEQLTAA